MKFSTKRTNHRHHRDQLEDPRQTFSKREIQLHQTNRCCTIVLAPFLCFHMIWQKAHPTTFEGFVTEEIKPQET